MAAVATRSSTSAVHVNPSMSAGRDGTSDSGKQTDSHKGNPKIEISASETKSSAANAPLAPPPKPNPQSGSDNPDYFAAGHNNSHLSYEPNPFEQSFGNPADGPGKVQSLPPVASLTSPAPLGPGGTPGWQGSLRSGPLSPAMLTGPAPSNYFDESFRGSYPTPNESSLRTGLTPGGGGSMFPAPSPNSQAIYNSLQSGGATPGTLDFQRTAMNAAARTKSDGNPGMTGATPQGINKQEYQPAQQMHPRSSDQFANHHETDAVNSLYLLAQTGNRSANQFAVPNQPMNPNTGQKMVNQTQESPTSHGRHSIGSIGTGMSDGEDYDMSDGSLDNKSSSKARGKRSSGGKAQATNGRRKADETPSKGHNKRNRNSIGDSDDEQNQQGGSSSNRKMTDEEKRRNFLERNRVAALKCRQRKKQWLANLQNKVEIFTAENEALSQQCNSLRDEIVNLKTLLLAHKDCPVTHAQGLGGNALAQIMGMQPGQQRP